MIQVIIDMLSSSDGRDPTQLYKGKVDLGLVLIRLTMLVSRGSQNSLRFVQITDKLFVLEADEFQEMSSSNPHVQGLPSRARYRYIFQPTEEWTAAFVLLLINARAFAATYSNFASRQVRRVLQEPYPGGR